MFIHLYSDNIIYTAGILFLLLCIAIIGYKKRSAAYTIIFREKILDEKKINKHNRQYLLYLAILIIVTALSLVLYDIVNNNELKQNTSQNEIIFLLDISNSMNVKDIGMARLEAAKKVIIDILKRLEHADFSVIIFAAEPQTIIPTTQDVDYSIKLIRKISTKFIENQGTNLSLAIESAVANFSNDYADNSIILLTDAENHNTEIETALKQIRNKNIKMRCIGFGTVTGGKIPMDEPQKYLQNLQGEDVISALDTTTLSKMDNSFLLYPVNIDNLVFDVYSASNENSANHLILIIPLFCLALLLYNSMNIF